MTATTTTTYLCGTDGLGGIHAMAGPEAQRAVCGAPGQVATRWGSYRTGLPLALRHPSHLCPACAWTVALSHGTHVAELEHWASNGASGPAGDLARRTAAAALGSITDHADADEPDAAPLRVLVKVCAHWPVDLLPEDCAEQECDHDSEEECATLVGSTACPACSVRSGPEAGEWEGQYEVPVTAPCSALTAAARYVGLPEVPA